MPPLKKFCLIAAIVLALTILVLETVPRWVELPGLGLRDLNPVAVGLEEARVEPHPYLAYVPKPGFTSKEGAKHQIAHNSLGFRGPEVVTPKPAGTFRVLCLGGSSTYGHGPTSNDTTWPARLQAYLKQAKPDMPIEVVNGGCQGYSSFESLANLAFRGLPLKPDLVIVAVPRAAAFESQEEFIHAQAWIMNWSLSFGRQEWDCVAVHPSVAEPKEGKHDDLIRKLVAAQDLTLIDRRPGDSTPPGEILRRWFADQLSRKH